MYVCTLCTYKEHIHDFVVYEYTNPAGSYPIAINLGVSPPGDHYLKIVSEDDEGFTAEDTVPYFIQSGSTPTGWHLS